MKAQIDKAAVVGAYAYESYRGRDARFRLAIPSGTILFVFISSRGYSVKLIPGHIDLSAFAL